MFNFLSAQQPVTRSYYFFSRFVGTIIGCWPKRQRAWYSYPIFVFVAVVVGIGASGELIYGFKYLKDLVSALEAFCPAITKAVTVLKIWVLFVYHRELADIVTRLKAMIMQWSKISAQQEVQKLSAIANRFSFMLLASGGSTATAFVLYPLLVYLYRWCVETPDNSLELPFNIVLPEFAYHYPYFPATYVTLSFSSLCTAMSFSFVDGFFFNSCIYICVVFRLIQHDIRSIFAELQAREVYTVEDNAWIQARLIVIVEHHNTIIDLCTELTAYFAVIILIYFLSIAFVLCSSILDLMLNSASISALIYILYSIAALIQLFVYCYGGSYVSESSSAVADTLYDIEWYKCDVKTRKIILMILRRSQKPKTIAVPFFTPSLPAFTSILSTAGSYITLLNTFL